MKKAELYQGDCLDVMRKLNDHSVDLFVVDPPFGINYRSCAGETIRNDRRPFIWWLYDAYRIAKRGGRLICFCTWKVQETFRMAIEAAGWNIRSQVIWDKQIHGAGNCKQDFGPQHEVIWYATKGTYNFKSRRPNSVLSLRYLFGHQRQHPNQKPLPLLEKLVSALSQPTETVVDCCMGVGSTGVASVSMGRKFIGIELDQDYFSIARQRITEATLCA